ncbi:hypothetical protein ASPBRDRAFT_40536 [Aspergillus brasiliensis CBS 101740]|uniref:Uncharacterized protein n=1 Tax=Aspergillus brasiliensis (strain CBS 101740 / IMI 381727 / IBT 21946) TaxID=767769 RepID=A0A1L9UU32_ASPBC|nr:hypothetical protein ASPBRDRAFT_40536 [Aspergillus brasiliensis CBS 101740]
MPVSIPFVKSHVLQHLHAGQSLQEQKYLPSGYGREQSMAISKLPPSHHHLIPSCEQHHEWDL